MKGVPMRAMVLGVLLLSGVLRPCVAQELRAVMVPPAWSSWADALEPLRQAVQAMQRGGSPAGAVAVTPSAGSLDALAAAYPPALRPAARRHYADLLREYAKVEQRFAVPNGDLGAAVAALVAGSSMAYRQTGFPDAAYKPLVAQMQGLLAADARIAQWSGAQRQLVAEQVSALGMQMAIAQMVVQRAPDAAMASALRRAGQSYLEGLLGLPAEQVTLGAAGVSLRVAAAPAPASATVPVPGPGSGPAAGLSARQVEAVLWSVRLRTTYYPTVQVHTDEDIFLLLADGTVMRGLDRAPADLDLAASRVREPARWGRWQAAGDGYALAWPDKPGRFEAVQATRVLPGKGGERLAGTWSQASSSEMVGVTRWGEQGVRFDADGRFEIFRSGGASVGGSGGTPQTMGVFHNEDSTVSTVGGAVVGGTSKRTGNAADRRGRYELDGYGIVLRFDNGTVRRQPFFIGGADQGVIYFDGQTLTRRKPK